MFGMPAQIPRRKKNRTVNRFPTSSRENQHQFFNLPARNFHQEIVHHPMMRRRFVTVESRPLVKVRTDNASVFPLYGGFLFGAQLGRHDGSVTTTHKPAQALILTPISGWGLFDSPYFECAMFGFLGGEFTPPTFTSLPEDALAVLLGVNRVTDFHQHQVEFIHSGELSGALVYGRLIDRQRVLNRLDAVRANRQFYFLALVFA